MDDSKGKKMTRSDNFQLIIEHMVAQGIEDSEQFMEFVTMILPSMTDADLEGQLCILEEKALDFIDMPL